jgi:hypothetical protein
VDFFKKTNFKEEHFRGAMCTRLKQIKILQETGKIAKDLRFIASKGSSNG